MARPTTYGTLEQVLEIYAGVWGAAADAEGADYWVNQIDNQGWAFTDVADSFFDQALVQGVYQDAEGAPLQGDDFLTALYSNIFKVAAPDAEGFAYWQGIMADMSIVDYTSTGVGNLAMQMIDGMWANPLTVDTTQMLYQNWITASEEFYANQEGMTPYSELSAADQDAFLAAASGLVDGITETSTPDEIDAAVNDATNEISPLTYELTQDAVSGQADEGETVTYTLTLSKAAAADATFTYDVSSTNANVTGDDFTTPTAGAITVAAGETAVTFTVGLADDGLAELAETYTVTIKDGATVIDTLNTTIVDTSTADHEKPVVTADQTFSYAENQVADATVATVLATDNVAVTGYAIDAADNADGFFAIDATGKITLTAAGIAAGIATNDFETAPNTFTLGVTATDAVGNVSDSVDVVLNVTDVDDIAPTLSSAVVVGTTATLNYSEALKTTAGAPPASDFNVTVKGAAGSISVSSVSVVGNTVTLALGRAPAAGETFQFDYTPTANPIQDVAGNLASAEVDKDLVADTTAPVITTGQTFSYMEGTLKAAGDLVGTVAATDAVGAIATFAIVTGNESGFYAIDSAGKITATAAGVAAAAASNDFETTPNSFTLGVKATDGAGNSATQNVVISVTNDTTDDAAAPIELTLTNQTDALAGLSGDDTFIGDQNSVQPADVIDGNGGKDTGRFTFAAATDVGAYNYTLTSREVETLKLQSLETDTSAGVDNVSTTFNAINVTELETLVDNNSAIEGNGVLAVINLKNQVTLGIVGGDGSDDFSVDYAPGVTVTNPLKVELDGANIRNLILVDDNHTAIEIKASGTNNSAIFDLLDGAADPDANLDNLTTLTFTGDKLLAIASELEGVTTYTATNNSGGVRVVIDDNKNVTFAGGSGLDRVNVQAAGLTSSDILDGGTGSDTLAVASGLMLSVGNAASVKGFEVLETTNAVAMTVANAFDVDNIIANNTLTDVVINGAGATEVKNINAGALTGSIQVWADEAGALTFTGKGFTASGGADAASIKLVNTANNAATGVDVASIDFAGLDNLTLTTVKSATQGNQQASIGSFVAGDLGTVTISGDNALSVFFTGAPELDTVTATGLTEALVVSVGNDNLGAGASITGTAKGDSLYGTNTIVGGTAATTSGDVLTGGAGSDTMVVDNDAEAAGRVRDTFRFTAATLGSDDLVANTTDTIYGFSAANAVLNDGLAATDDVITLTSGVQGSLKVGGTALTSLTNGTLLGTAFDNSNNIRAVLGNTVGGVATDTHIQIDLNGNGAWDAASDFQMILKGIAVDGTNIRVEWDKDAGVLYAEHQTAATAINGTNMMVGSGAGDAMTGSAGADVINGNDGADAITGGAGADSITGGAGVDTLAFNAEATNGIDVITLGEVDGTPITDILNFTNLSAISNGATSDIVIVNDADVEAGANAFGAAGDNIIILTGDYAADAAALSALTFDGFAGLDTGKMLVVYSSSAIADARIAIADVAAGGDLSGATDLCTLVGVTVVEASTGFVNANFVMD
jgi:hypothetical protein